MKKNFVGFITALAMVIMALPICQVKAAEMKTVTVSNAEELLAAIASDTKIMLKPGEYKITEETITTDWGSYKEERNVYIHDIKNLQIYGNGQAEITLDVGDMAVISTYNASNIVFDGLTLGHDVPERGCQGDGDVFRFRNSSNIQINNCDMYGCGIHGIYSSDTDGISVTDSIIRDCSNGIVLFEYYNTEAGDIVFNNCSFLRNAYDSQYRDYPAFANNYSEVNINIIFNNCTFTDNINTRFAGDGINVTTNNCSFENNAWDKPLPPINVSVGYNKYWGDDFVRFGVSIHGEREDEAEQIKEMKLILAEYDDNGQLINVTLGEQFKPTGGVIYDVNLKIKCPDTDNYKYMIWGKNNFPLMDAVTDVQP